MMFNDRPHAISFSSVYKSISMCVRACNWVSTTLTMTAGLLDDDQRLVFAPLFTVTMVVWRVVVPIND